MSVIPIGLRNVCIMDFELVRTRSKSQPKPIRRWRDDEINGARRRLLQEEIVCGGISYLIRTYDWTLKTVESAVQVDDTRPSLAVVVAPAGKPYTVLEEVKFHV